MANIGLGGDSATTVTCRDICICDAVCCWALITDTHTHHQCSRCIFYLCTCSKRLYHTMHPQYYDPDTWIPPLVLSIDSRRTTQIFADTAFAVSLGQFSRLSDMPWHSRQKYWQSIANTEATRRKSSRPALVFLFLCRQTSGKLYPDLTQSRHLTCEPGWNVIHKCTHSPECSDTNGSNWGSCSL